MFLEAFVSTLRSATFALQKALLHYEGFRQWYRLKQEEMKGDSKLQWIVQLRNVVEKEGLILATYGPRAIVRVHRDGIVAAEVGQPTLRIDGMQQEDLLSVLDFALSKIETIIEEAHSMFKSRAVDHRHRVSVQFLREMEDGSWEPMSRR